MLRHREDPRPKAGAEEARTALGERSRDEWTAIRVQEIERDEDRAAATFRGLGTESSSEKVVTRTAARVADDDLAVEDCPLRQTEIAQLGHGGEEVAARSVGQAKSRRVTGRERADPIPLELEDVLRRIERTARETRSHRDERPGQGARCFADVDQGRMRSTLRSFPLARRHPPRIRVLGGLLSRGPRRRRRALGF